MTGTDLEVLAWLAWGWGQGALHLPGRDSARQPAPGVRPSSSQKLHQAQTSQLQRCSCLDMCLVGRTTRLCSGVAWVCAKAEVDDCSAMILKDSHGLRLLVQGLPCPQLLVHRCYPFIAPNAKAVFSQPPTTSSPEILLSVTELLLRRMSGT